ncbi:hypothetical protein BC332_32899 [Capsicum chinense]|nr:hypothetical protein BC332_32899 [Capsicum chinense]
MNGRNYLKYILYGKEAANPFEYCDLVTTTTTHKSLRGGPHNHQIAAFAVALKPVMTPGFKAYAKQAKANVVALGNFLMSKGYTLVTSWEGDWQQGGEAL